MSLSWDEKFMRIATEIASWSKHPTIKVGCVIVDDEHNQLSGGYNGLPRGANDTVIHDQSRAVSTTVHAEANAVAGAARNGHSLKGSTAYVTRPVCAQCAALLVQAGIKRVVFQFEGEFSGTQPGWVKAEFDKHLGSWAYSCYVAYELFMEVGVKHQQHITALWEINPSSHVKLPRCPSMHGGQQCQWFAGHLGPHQECNEVWIHA